MTLAIGVWEPKREQEVMRLRRTARTYGARFTFQVGGADYSGPGLMPHHRVLELHELNFLVSGPVDLVAVELDSHAVPLSSFQHPEHAAYLIGPENGTIPRPVLDTIGRIVKVETPLSGLLEPATAGAIVLHDRYTYLSRKEVA